MKIAIVGGGISGLTAAYLLSREHEIILYESNDYIGGHTNTVSIEIGGSPVAVDTGFIVYNQQNYPNFSHILSDLNVSTQPTSMSFSVKLIEPDLEYNGSSLKQLFGQKNISAAPAAIIMSLEGVIAAIAAWIILNQILGLDNIIGCSLILGGVLLSQLAPIYEKNYK